MPGVEALHGLTADPHDELRSGRTERDAVTQDAISGRGDPLPDDGDHCQISATFRQNADRTPSAAAPDLFEDWALEVLDVAILRWAS
jgi:hypothetical protein